MERFVVALTRTCGSGGTTISRMLADDFGIDMYDCCVWLLKTAG